MNAYPLMAESSSILIAVLFHFVWQTVLVCMVVAVIHALAGAGRPTIRYWTGVAAMLLLIVAPLATGAYLVANPDSSSAFQLKPGLAGAELTATTIPDSSIRTEHSDGTLFTACFGVYQSALSWIISSKLIWLSGWIAGVCVLASRLLMSWVFCWQVRRSARPLDGKLRRLAERLKRQLNVSSNLLIATSGQVTQAVAVGIVRPAILIPASWISEMPIKALEAVIAHELAHIRRWDVFVNLVQRVVETIFFFHPLVWWLSRRIRHDRELCCDQIAIRATNNRITYVETLARVAELRVSRSAVELGTNFIGGKKMNLLRRIHVALEPNSPRNHVSFRAFSIGGMFTFFLLAFSWVSFSTQAAVYQPAKWLGNQEDPVHSHQHRQHDQRHDHSHQHLIVGAADRVVDHDVLHLLVAQDDEHRSLADRVHADLLLLDENGKQSVAQVALATLLQDDESPRQVDRAELARKLRQLADEILKSEGENDNRNKKKSSKQLIQELEIHRAQDFPLRHKILDRRHNVLTDEKQLIIDVEKGSPSDQKKNLEKVISNLQQQIEELRHEIKKLRSTDQPHKKTELREGVWELQVHPKHQGLPQDKPRVKLHVEPKLKLHPEHKLHLETNPHPEHKVQLEYKLHPGKDIEWIEKPHPKHKQDLWIELHVDPEKPDKKKNRPKDAPVRLSPGEHKVIVEYLIDQADGEWKSSKTLKLPARIKKSLPSKELFWHLEKTEKGENKDPKELDKPLFYRWRQRQSEGDDGEDPVSRENRKLIFDPRLTDKAGTDPLLPLSDPVNQSYLPTIKTDSDVDPVVK